MIKIKKNCHKRSRCFVIASGPSIKSMDLKWLEHEITICVNESYKALPFDPTYICIGDKALYPLVKDKYAKMSSKIICATGLDGTVGSDYPGNNLYGVLPLNKKQSVDKGNFNFNLKNGVNIAWNVIPEVAIPFACWCGFSECYLIGCDCTNMGYFYEGSSRGDEFQAFDKRAMQSYFTISKEKLPTKIYNATIGGNLDCFDRSVFPPREKKLLVTGYYTPDRNYKQLANQMKESVELFGLDCEIVERESLAKIKTRMRKPMPWVLNCSQCGSHIKDVRKRHPGRDILYLDADAVMVRRPSLFLDYPRNYDFAVVFYTGGLAAYQLSSNCMYFAGTSIVDKLVDEWIKLQEERNNLMLGGKYKKPYMEAWDQETLQLSLDKAPGLRYLELPWGYSKITPPASGKELMPGVNEEEIVIEQYQASRQNRRFV